MKKIRVLLISFFAFFAFSSVTLAAGSASLSVSSTKIENGASVKASVTVKNAAAWNVKISSSGNTNGCTQIFADASSDGNNVTKTFTVTCKATSVGVINFVLSGDITSSDGVNTKVSGSKAVTVTAPRAKSKNNKLKSLSVEGFTISPEFNKDVNEYSVTVPSTTQTIKINATKEDSYSKIEGIGEKNVEEGTNVFEIIVTSETGVSNVYKLTVDVLDQNPIEVVVNGEKYTVVKVAKNLEKPELFEETTININEFEIPAFINTVTNYTLVGLKNENGDISLFIYDNGNYTKYNEFVSARLNIIFLDMKDVPKNYIKETIKINDQEVVAYKIEDSSNYLVYGINLETGKKNYYSYDPNENTLQIFELKNYEDKEKDMNNNKYLVYILSVCILFLIIILVLVNAKSRKLKKLLKLKSVELETKEKEISLEKEKRETKPKNKKKK